MVLPISKCNLYILVCILASFRTFSLGFQYVSSEFNEFEPEEDSKERNIENVVFADEIEEKIFGQLEIDTIWRRYLKPIEVKQINWFESTPTPEEKNIISKFRKPPPKKSTFRSFKRPKTTHEETYFVVQIVSKEEIIERTALRDPSRLWEGKTVPYSLSDAYQQSELDVILKAIEGFHNETCLTFKQREEEGTYISIEPGTGCSAVLGKREGLNRVKISENCYEIGIVQHEIMHVFGFLHEQSRPDRDDYITVVWDNIAERYKKNFDKKTWDQVQVFGQPYDYASVMHYGRFEFSLNQSSPSIIPLEEGVEIGQRDTFSKIDLIKINAMFDCPSENS